MAVQKLWARPWESRQSAHLTGSIGYCSPEPERYGVNRTGRDIQPHTLASATASGLLAAQAGLTQTPHPANFWLLRPGSGPCEGARSQGHGTYGARAGRHVEARVLDSSAGGSRSM